jgi:hypothetical protein
MTETAVLLLAIAAASLAVAVSVGVSLARIAPPAPPARPGPDARRALPAHVLCPMTGGLARVEIGFDRDTGKLAVARCEHFPSGVFECERECFPTLMLTPLAIAPTG